MGRRGSKRGKPLNGMFLLDKPPGLSSNAALQQVKRLFGAAKAGHTGSLDPLATGMLPICFGEATKFSQFMLDADKEYRTTARLGVRTASGDTDSETIAEREVPSFSGEQLERALRAFLGETEQVPSMFSALKHHGQPLYKLAREGIEVERKPRKIVISKIELLAARKDELDIELHCSKGTYIRSLIDDLGERLGCGAHVVALRRLAVSGLAGQRMYSLEEVAEIAAQGAGTHECEQNLQKLLLPVETAVEGLPEVELNDLLAYYIRQGQPVFVPNTRVEGKVVLFNREASEEERFLGVGEVLDDGRVAPRRLVNVG